MMLNIIIIVALFLVILEPSHIQSFTHLVNKKLPNLFDGFDLLLLIVEVSLNILHKCKEEIQSIFGIN